jgi:hypothetical protein
VVDENGAQDGIRLAEFMSEIKKLPRFQRLGIDHSLVGSIFLEEMKRLNER